MKGHDIPTKLIKTFDSNSIADKSILVAIFLWLLSLVFVAIVTYKGLAVRGYGILLNGYWGAYYYNFAWFANAAFIVTLFRYFEKREPPWIMAALAAVLSVQGLTFDFVYSGGNSAPLYGYGPGYVLWYSALLWLMFSVGLRLVERTQTPIWKNFYCVASLALLICFLSFVVFKTISTREAANAAEREFMATHSVVYTRNAVCSNEPPAPLYKLELNGPIELVDETGKYPFGNVTILLDWGLKTIRVGHFDYSYSYSPNGTRILLATEKRGFPVGILRVLKRPLADTRGYSITINLTDFKTGGEIFSETWENRGRHDSSICPRFKSLPEPGELPRSLIISALNGLEIPGSDHRTNQTDESTTDFIEITSLPPLIESTQAAQLCPQGMGYLSKEQLRAINSLKPLAVKFNNAFAMGDQRYFFESRTNRSLCVNNSIYMYRLRASKSSFFVRIAKKNAANFHEHWITELNLSKTNYDLWSNNIHLSITEVSDTEAIVKIVDATTQKQMSYRLEIKL